MWKLFIQIEYTCMEKYAFIENPYLKISQIVSITFKMWQLSLFLFELLMIFFYTFYMSLGAQKVNLRALIFRFLSNRCCWCWCAHFPYLIIDIWLVLARSPIFIKYLILINQGTQPYFVIKHRSSYTKLGQVRQDWSYYRVFRI